MASLSTTKLVGIALIICSAGLAYWGYDMSGGFSSQMNHAFTGSDTNEVIYRYVAAGISLIVGVLLLKK